MLDTGEQKLIIGKNCLRNGNKGAVIHELMHSPESAWCESSPHLFITNRAVQKKKRVAFKNQWCNDCFRFLRKTRRHRHNPTDTPYILARGLLCSAS